MAGTRLDPRLSFDRQRHFFFHLSSKKLGKSLVPRAGLDLDSQRIKYADLWRETCVCARGVEMFTGLCLHESTFFNKSCTRCIDLQSERVDVFSITEQD